MELLTATTLLVLGQLLSLAVAEEEQLVGAQLSYNTTAYTSSGPKPELFTVGGDRVQVKISGCFRRNHLVCCLNKPMLEGLSGARLCSDFGSVNCCFMIPGRQSHPRLPRDLIPLLPSLTSPGQCELRRKGRRVLHCCHGTLPDDPNPSAKAARICSSVNRMRCCYYPFAGLNLNFLLSGTKDNHALTAAIRVANEE